MGDLDPTPSRVTTHWLDVGDGHRLRILETGRHDGEPVVFLHGGPGGGVSTVSARFFDPTRYRVILFDQRGAGRSTPTASVHANTTWHLVADIERVRSFMGVDRWHVFGGSWGSTLALAYAATHPEAVRSLCLRGIFLARRKEVRWLYQFGASELFPDAWDTFVAPIPEDERYDMVAAYHRRLMGDDRDEQLRCARAWSVWEGSISRLEPEPGVADRFASPAFALPFARIEAHYFANDAFFETDGWLLEQVDRIRHVPAVIVQGRYDVVCPVRSAWDLATRWPEADLRIVTAGHSSFDPAIASALVDATGRLVDR